MSHVTRKPVFGVCDQEGINQPAQLKRLALDLARIDIILSK